MLLISAEAIDRKLHDADIDLGTLTSDSDGVRFSGILFDVVKVGKRSTPAKFRYRALLQGASGFEVEDPDCLQHLSVCGVSHQDARLVIASCAVGQLTILCPRPVLLVEQESTPCAT